MPKGYKNINLSPELATMVDQIKADQLEHNKISVTDKQVVELALRFYVAAHYSEDKDVSKQDRIQ
jgi:hypothetical protein